MPDEHPSPASAPSRPPGWHRRDRRPARLGAHRGPGRRGRSVRGRRDRQQPAVRQRRPPVLILTSGAHRGHRQGRGHPRLTSSGPTRTSCGSTPARSSAGSPIAHPAPVPTYIDPGCGGTTWLGRRRPPRRRVQHDVRRAGRDDRRHRDRGGLTWRSGSTRPARSAGRDGAWTRRAAPTLPAATSTSPTTAEARGAGRLGLEPWDIARLGEPVAAESPSATSRWTRRTAPTGWPRWSSTRADPAADRHPRRRHRRGGPRRRRLAWIIDGT